MSASPTRRDGTVDTLMRFGIDVAQRNLSWAELVSRVRFAEELGFDCAWGFDHLASTAGQGDQGGRADQADAAGGTGGTFEGMTTLAALSGHTSRIRLGLLVTAVTHRHPAVLAAQAMTVDHASGGRLNLALGAAWDRDAHHAFGIPFPSTPDRFALLADTVEVVTRLYSGEPVGYDGTTVSLRKAQLLPRPVQSPRPPIWIGGTGPRRTLPLTAWYADAWHAYGTPAVLAPYSRRLDDLATAAGRTPSDILRASTLSLDGPPDDVDRRLDAWREAGWDYLVCSWPSGGRDALESFAATVLPQK